ncbi:hypothetical protein, partial [Escherichia fergusonii]|uniref:hypothetical protein n=1 Tax=Escherichia fergusonii TaxID=564 RepID=UPI001C5CAB9B
CAKRVFDFAGSCHRAVVSATPASLLRCTGQFVAERNASRSSRFEKSDRLSLCHDVIDANED